MSEEIKSTHKCEIIPLVMEKHPNADTLSVVTIFGGYTCCVRTEDWKDIKLAAYIPPDSTVDVRRPEFSFLATEAKADGRARIKAKKLRGIVSFGCLVPAPPNFKEGDDAAAFLDVQHYEPPMPGDPGTPKERLFMGGEIAPAPKIYTVKYDVDAFRRYHKAFIADEPVIVTEKIDGCNARYTYHDGTMHCGSREEWKKEYPSYDHVTVEKLVEKEVPEDKAKEIVAKLQNSSKSRNLWWTILANTPTLEKYCRDNPGHVVYGECYGNIGRIKYGQENQFAAFDLMIDGKWVDGMTARDMLANYQVPLVPLLGVPKYNFDTICSWAEGATNIPGCHTKTIREGCVIKPIVERVHRSIGRVCLKCVSPVYLERY